MANLKDVIYLSNDDYEILSTTGTVTINGVVLTYDENCLYITPDTVATTLSDGLMSSQDKTKLDNVGSKVTSISNSSTDMQYPSAKCVYDIIKSVNRNIIASNSTTVLEYETINNISINASREYTLATHSVDIDPEYRANITNTDASNAITITLPSGTIIKAEQGITVSSNTFTIPADTTVIVSIQNDLALIIIKG